jgi:LysR family transcriptional regulator, transcriptional activator of nhaA
MFNYNHLYYFYTLGRIGSVTKAAKNLRVAQPSLSIQIRKLEDELSMKLFEKVGRRLHLTPGGERVFEYCRNIFGAAEELEDYLKYSRGLNVERCRIGVDPEIERPFVADVLSGLLHNNTKTRPLLSLITNNHKDLMAQLSHGDIDVVVTSQKVQMANVKILAELAMPVVAVANLKKLKMLDPRQSLSAALKQAGTDLILPSSSLKLRLEADMFLLKNKIRNPVVFDSDILSVIVRAVVEGVGVGFLPRNYIQKEIASKNVTILNEGAALWNTKLFVLARSQKVKDQTIQLIRKHFIQLGGKA